MAPYKRPRCETEDPEDDRAEEQLLNRLDQEKYEEEMRLLPSRFGLAYRNRRARKKFWDKFYSTDELGIYSECPNQSLNARARKIVEERRKSCPWYFWGLEGYTRKRFPEGWPYFYENGHEGNVSEDNQLLYPWDDELHATSAGSPAAAKGADKAGLWDLPSSEMEKSVEDTKMQIAEIKAMLVEKLRKFGELQTEADAKIDEIRTEVDAKINEIETDVTKLEETIKEKKSILEVQEITLAARRANDSYGK
ncbi:hypothetical protein V498_08448 [Pseudogymnoascus sp. VKM F-4517 (FW-2822)]|nr:hypothetical protein V498_08448 [Pseudogymnoascus sp. VKM F-4517 (FW-2822)]